MPTGNVKWFDNKKGYGFIRQPDLNEDIFVHYSAIQGKGFKTLEDGEAVEFELVKGQKGFQADKVVRVAGAKLEVEAVGAGAPSMMK